MCPCLVARPAITTDWPQGTFREDSGCTQGTLGVHPESTQGTLRVFSGYRVLSASRFYFFDLVYIFVRSPESIGDGWTKMRCSCHPAGLHVRCEHTEYLRRFPLEACVETPLSLESMPKKNSGGRKQGSTVTARGKAAALKREAETKGGDAGSATSVRDDSAPRPSQLLASPIENGAPQTSSGARPRRSRHS